MAKRSSRSNNTAAGYKTAPQRETTTNFANQRLLRDLQIIAALEDRRRYNPTITISPLASTKRSHTQIKAKKSVDNTSRIRFNQPKKISLCAKRKIRKEVIIATKKTRAGAGTKKKRNFWSKVSC